MAFLKHLFGARDGRNQALCALIQPAKCVVTDFPHDDPTSFRDTVASACICVHLWFHLDLH